MSRIGKNEQGMVSLLVTMILILVISLIVLGFAQVGRRNQREALDSQLSTEAYYAAESGVNVAATYFSHNPTAPGIDTTGNCTQFITGTLGGIVGPNGTNDLTHDATNYSVKYTCLMVNSEPTSLVATTVQQDANTVWHVANADPVSPTPPFTSLKFQWTQDPDSPSLAATDCSAGPSVLPNYAADPTDPAVVGWSCPYGLLRIDLVDTSSVTSAALENNTGVHSLYLIPSTTTGVASANLQGPVQIIHVQNCNSSNCTFTLNIPSGGSADYYVRLTMLYQDAGSVTLTGQDANGTTKFSGGQAVIDSTGQAQDELRRIQARIPLSITSAAPAYALQSTDTVCKQLDVAPSVYDDSCPPPASP